jgi:hypothetical protein
MPYSFNASWNGVNAALSGPNVQVNRTRPSLSLIEATKLPIRTELAKEPKAGFRLNDSLGMFFTTDRPEPPIQKGRLNLNALDETHFFVLRVRWFCYELRIDQASLLCTISRTYP